MGMNRFLNEFAQIETKCWVKIRNSYLVDDALWQRYVVRLTFYSVAGHEHGRRKALAQHYRPANWESDISPLSFQDIFMT